LKNIQQGFEMDITTPGKSNLVPKIFKKKNTFEEKFYHAKER